MKQVFILLMVSTVNNIHSYVIYQGKSAAKVPLLEAVNSEKLSYKKQESLKTFTADERGIYLDDVLFALNNQNWTEEEQPCLNQTLLMLQNLQNFTLWAVWRECIVVYFYEKF